MAWRAEWSPRSTASRAATGSIAHHRPRAALARTTGRRSPRTSCAARSRPPRCTCTRPSGGRSRTSRCAPATDATAIDTGAHTVTLADGETVEYGRLALATGRDAAHASRHRAASARSTTPRRWPQRLDGGPGPPGRDRRRVHRRRGGRERAHEGLGRDDGRARGRRLGAPVRRRGRPPTSSASWRARRHGAHRHEGAARAGDYDVRAGRASASRRTPSWPRPRASTVDNGVQVDEHLRAGDDVWAVGDIADYQSVVHGRRMRIEHWDVALNQGAYVGRSWAGKEDGPTPSCRTSSRTSATGRGSSTSARASGRVEVRGSMDADDFVAYYPDDDGPRSRPAWASTAATTSRRPKS